LISNHQISQRVLPSFTDLWSNFNAKRVENEISNWQKNKKSRFVFFQEKQNNCESFSPWKESQ
jgi:hypothetical protein